jgi:hypothetical protein
MKTAREVRERFVGNGPALRPWARLDEEIARALLAERERCARVADDYPKRDPGGDGNGFWAAEEIAAAIRNA